MPIYGYRCAQCGHELEVFQSMSDAPLKDCPECGGTLRKLLYPVGVQFKGSGFYTTDYARNGSAAKSETKTGDGGGTGDKAGDKGSGGDGGSKSEGPSEKKKAADGAAEK